MQVVGVAQPILIADVAVDSEAVGIGPGVGEPAEDTMVSGGYVRAPSVPVVDQPRISVSAGAVPDTQHQVAGGRGAVAGRAIQGSGGL